MWKNQLAKVCRIHENVAQNPIPAIVQKWVPYSQRYLFNAIPDTNHNANPTNPNRYSKVNPNPTNPVSVRHSEGPPFRRSCPPFRSEAIGGRKSIGRIPRVRVKVRVRVRVRLDQPAIQVLSRSFGVADLRNGGPKPLTH